MSFPISRRVFAAGSVATVLGGTAAFPLPALRAAAHAGTDFAGLGLPALDITVTPDGFQGVGDELEAGRYHVTATFAEGIDEAGVLFTRPPDGTSVDEFIDLLGIGSVPTASPAASESEEVQAFPLPLEVYQSVFTGGPVGHAGEVMETVIDLPPGEWILWSGETSPEEYVPPMAVTVTGEMPADLPEPEADVTMTYIDFAISVEGALTAGDHIMRIENQGAQPHFLVLFKGTEAVTNEGVAAFLAFLAAGPDATPPDLAFEPDVDVQYLMTTGAQSIGTSLWLTMTFEQGKYVAICYFPTAGTGVLHALHGMHTVFEVT